MENFSILFELQSYFQKKGEELVFFIFYFLFLFLFQAALRPLATGQCGKKNGEVEGVSVVWGERLILVNQENDHQEKESEGGRVEIWLLGV